MAPISFDTQHSGSGLDEMPGDQVESAADDFDDVEQELWCSAREAGLSFAAVFEETASR